MRRKRGAQIILEINHHLMVAYLCGFQLLATAQSVDLQIEHKRLLPGGQEEK